MSTVARTRRKRPTLAERVEQLSAALTLQRRDVDDARMHAALYEHQAQHLARLVSTLYEAVVDRNEVLTHYLKEHDARSELHANEPDECPCPKCRTARAMLEQVFNTHVPAPQFKRSAVKLDSATAALLGD